MIMSKMVYLYNSLQLPNTITVTQGASYLHVECPDLTATITLSEVTLWRRAL